MFLDAVFQKQTIFQSIHSTKMASSSEVHMHQKVSENSSTDQQ